MKNVVPVRSLVSGIFMSIVISAVLVISIRSSFAQQKYQKDDIIEVKFRDKPTKAKVQQCNSDGCSVYIWEEALGRFADGTLSFFNQSIIRLVKGAANPSNGPASKGNNSQSQPGPPVRATPNKSAGCPSDSGITETPKAGSSMDKIFKHAIFENYQAEINNSTTSPLKVGVTFEEFEIGQATVNRVTPHGVEYPSAAVGAKLYPVKTKHTLCRLYNGGPTQTLFEGRFTCFKNRQNEWVCPTAPGHKILGYK